jgi:hypothetical protein
MRANIDLRQQRHEEARLWFGTVESRKLFREIFAEVHCPILYRTFQDDIWRSIALATKMTKSGGKPNPDNAITADTSLSNGLTPKEMWELTTDYQSGTVSTESMLETRRDLIVDELVATNSRTGCSCKLAVLEYVNNEEDCRTDYVLELRFPEGIVEHTWEYVTGTDFGSLMRIQQAAHKSFITWSALIGVKVGYALVVKPSPYQAQEPA